MLVLYVNCRIEYILYNKFVVRYIYILLLNKGLERNIYENIPQRFIIEGYSLFIIYF
jgi:hypothetical protein